jgi:peptidoglycan pentaglycine glycine transferase (the first glycine)
MQLQRIEQTEEWDEILLGLPEPHLLQSWTWGELKARYGWHAERWIWRDERDQTVGAAQLLLRSIRGGLTMAYAPRGPVLDWDQPKIWRPILEDLQARAAEQGAFFLKIDPSLRIPHSDDEAPPLAIRPRMKTMLDSGWVLSNEQVQFRNTLVIDLTQDEEMLLANMKQKTRYNVRLAERRGVTVREGTTEDLGMLYRMYAETSIRDGFVIRPEAYYQDVWGMFMTRGQAAPLIAEVEGEAVAAMIVYRFGPTAYYLYGMSRDAHREKMSTYLLQWEAMRWAKARGCTRYDLWGAPHEIEEDDPMYGVYRFKLGFGAELVRTPGAWDYPIKPFTYRLYTTVMPPILSLMRFFGQAHTRAQVQDV